MATHKIYSEDTYAFTLNGMVYPKARVRPVEHGDWIGLAETGDRFVWLAQPAPCTEWRDGNDVSFLDKQGLLDYLTLILF
jgi:hypothetical protein